MASCKISSGLELDCTDKKLGAGGLQQKVWLFNPSDVTPTFNADETLISDFTSVSGYGFLYPFVGFKNSSTTDDGSQNQTGLAFFPHTVTISTLDTTPEAIKTLNDLAYSDGVCAIVETTGGQFRVFGWKKGLTLESMVRESGTTVEEGTSRLVTLTGQLPDLPKIFLDTDYATSLAKLIAWEV